VAETRVLLSHLVAERFSGSSGGQTCGATPFAATLFYFTRKTTLNYIYAALSSYGQGVPTLIRGAVF